MNQIRLVRAGLLCLLLLGALVPQSRGQSGNYAVELNAVLSRLQSMGRDSYTSEDWRDVSDQLKNIAQRAEQNGDWNSVVQARIIEAMVLGDMRGEYDKALAILKETKKQYGSKAPSEMKKVYVREAEMYSKMGDEAAVQRLIKEFEASPYYDKEVFPYSGGQGPNVPLSVTRPAGQGSDSISVTAMEVARKRAQITTGSYFPDFKAVNQQGAAISLTDFRGKVLLVDFWLMNWTPWTRDLPNLVSTYSRYHDAGFEIVGFCLDSDTSGLDAFLRSRKIIWPQVVGDHTLARQLSIFGEAANYLVDQNGMIIARDLRGADLVEAVKNALNKP